VHAQAITRIRTVRRVKSLRICWAETTSTCGAAFCGLSERSWLNWTEQIRQRCGEELLRRGMFPPRKYFSSEMTDLRSTATD
jgi:hypothetical protein